MTPSKLLILREDTDSQSRVVSRSEVLYHEAEAPSGRRISTLDALITIVLFLQNGFWCSLSQSTRAPKWQSDESLNPAAMQFPHVCLMLLLSLVLCWDVIEGDHIIGIGVKRTCNHSLHLVADADIISCREMRGQSDQFRSNLRLELLSY